MLFGGGANRRLVGVLWLVSRLFLESSCWFFLLFLLSVVLVVVVVVAAAVVISPFPLCTLYFSGLIVSRLAPRPCTSRLVRHLWNENPGGDSSSPGDIFKKKVVILDEFRKKA